MGALRELRSKGLKSLTSSSGFIPDTDNYFFLITKHENIFYPTYMPAHVSGSISCGSADFRYRATSDLHNQY